MQQGATKAPMLLVHGDMDKTVFTSQSVWMDEEAKRLGYPVELVIVENAAHSFEDAGEEPISLSVPEISKLTLDFIVKNNK